MTATLLQCLMLLATTSAQFISPCPKLFEYDPTGQQNDRWHGTVTLISDSELSGVWLRLVFDKPSIQIGNWFGEVKTTDHIEYLIENRNQKLRPNTPLKVPFFVRYDPGETPPQLTMFRLNAKTVCPEEGAATEAAVTSGQLLTSSILSTTSSPGFSNGNSVHLNQVSNDHNNVSNVSHKENFHPIPPDNQKIPCGTIGTKPTPLISHGQNTTRGQWPWHAAIYHTQGPSLVYTCGGSLVSDTHVLTAAHCVTKLHTTKPTDISRLTVYLGKYKLKSFGPETQSVEISHTFIHPYYNSSNLFNDIAVLKLKETVEFTNFVRPVCLWDGSQEIEKLYNKLGTVVGWGFDENRKISEYLMQAQMPVVPVSTCIYSNREFFSHFTFEKNFCAGYRNGTSVCNGDSGGGMVFPKSGTNGGNPVWVLRGLVSVGVALQDEGVCDPTHYSVFTDIAKHSAWIREVMKQ